MVIARGVMIWSNSVDTAAMYALNSAGIMYRDGEFFAPKTKPVGICTYSSNTMAYAIAIAG